MLPAVSRLRCGEALHQAQQASKALVQFVQDIAADLQPCSQSFEQRHKRNTDDLSGSGAGALTTHGRVGGSMYSVCAPQHSSSLRSYQTATVQSSSADDEAAVVELASKLLNDDDRHMLTPTAIVERLDKYIVGQADAKRAVAVALRNRWRRSQLPKVAADEVMPKNILMVGPTGCGKTEIARRLAKLADAPFIKVEATKYTELGYVGRDVEDMIKDLVEAAQTLVRTRLRERVAAVTAQKVEAAILTGLCGEHATEDTLNMFRDLLRQGALDNTEVEVEVPVTEQPQRNFNFGNGFIMIDHMMRDKMGAGGKKTERKKMKVSEARSRIEEGEADKVMSSEMVTREAIRAAEQDGIVFIDEIDKIVEGSGGRLVGGGVSSEGVQRDLLPIIEGSTVNTKYGNVNTDHILFICSGAFHTAKPSDMLAELQGRLPIRVELKGLTANDFYRILTEPENNMIRQQTALLETEGVHLKFTEGALRRIANVAEEANRLLDNIGARRLHTVLERCLSDISFSAPDKVEEARRNGQTSVDYVVDEEYVDKVMADVLKKKDLSRYVL